MYENVKQKTSKQTKQNNVRLMNLLFASNDKTNSMPGLGAESRTFFK